MQDAGSIFLHKTLEQKYNGDIFVFFFRIKWTQECVSDNFNTELFQIISILPLYTQEIINPHYAG